PRVWAVHQVKNESVGVAAADQFAGADDARVVQVGQDPPLREERLDELGLGGRLRTQLLDRDPQAGCRVAAAPDGTDRPLGDLRLKLVPATADGPHLRHSSHLSPPKRGGRTRGSERGRRPDGTNWWLSFRAAGRRLSRQRVTACGRGPACRTPRRTPAARRRRAPRRTRTSSRPAAAGPSRRRTPAARPARRGYPWWSRRSPAGGSTPGA